MSEGAAKFPSDHHYMASDSDDQSSGGILSSGESSSGLFAEFVEEYSEEELATILIIAGFVLFFIPGLQVVGGISILIGAITWFSDWLWG